MALLLFFLKHVFGEASKAEDQPTLARGVLDNAGTFRVVRLVNFIVRLRIYKFVRHNYFLLFDFLNQLGSRKIQLDSLRLEEGLGLNTIVLRDV